MSDFEDESPVTGERTRQLATQYAEALTVPFTVSAFTKLENDTTGGWLGRNCPQRAMNVKWLEAKLGLARIPPECKSHSLHHAGAPAVVLADQNGCRVEAELRELHGTEVLDGG